MPWVIQDLNGVIDSSNRDFTISNVPEPGSLIVVQQGIILEAVGSQPEAMQLAYSLNTMNMTLGLAPLVGQQRPWCRYWWES